MEIFDRFKKKENNEWQSLVTLFLIVVLLIWKSIIDSGHLIFYIVCLVLWVVLYYLFGFIQKKNISKPASLWGIYSMKYPIIIQYAPPKWINPAEAWLLYNCSVEPTDLTSMIYQWKFEDLIDIQTFKWENSKKEYVKLIKKSDLPLDRPLFESEIFDSIFRMWDVKIIEWAFQLRYALMLEDLEFHWIQKWWLVESKKESKNSWFFRNYQFWWGVAIFWLFLFLSVFSIIMDSFDIPGIISFSFAEFIWFLIVIFWIWFWVIIFYWRMDWSWRLKFTDEWAKIASQVIGYSQFIKSCDENKIRLFLKEDPLFIDRTLPYATAFGMETEFLNKISPLKKDWNAKYVRGQKVPVWIWTLRFLLKDSDNNF